jgi:hypothetical protein
MLKNIFILFCLIICLISCKSSDPAPAKSSEKKMISFSFATPVLNAVIDTINNSVFTIVPLGTDFTKLTPTISVSENASVSPASGILQDFTKPVTYTVTAEDGTLRKFTVTIAYFVDIVGKWKVDYYIDSKLQPSNSNNYLNFYSDKTFSPSEKTMASQNNTAQVYWGAYQYSVLTNLQYRQRSSQNAATLDDAKLTEKDAPFIIGFSDGTITTQYQPPTGYPRSTYGYPFAAKAFDKNSFTLYLAVKDNLLELRLSRIN